MMLGAIQRAYRRPGQTVGDPTLIEKLDLVPAISSLAGTLLWGFVTAGFRGPQGASSYKHHISHATIRKVGTRLSTSQVQYISPAFPDLYRKYCRLHHVQPNVVTLKEGTEAYWIGSPKAKNIIIYFHGGGFSMDGDFDHFRFWADVVGNEPNSQKPDTVAFLFLAYTLVPYATYPTQIHEAAEVLDYVLNELKRSPTEVSLAGDSAGGNMCLALLSLMLHPDPDLPKVSLDKPLKAMILVGPWVSFNLDVPSASINAQKDILTPYAECLWAKDYLAGQASNFYTEPMDADAEWWQGAEHKVSHVLATVGGHEILLDHAKTWAGKYQAATSEKHFEFVIGDGEGHIAPIIEPLLCDNSPTEQGDAILSFVKLNFPP